MENDTQHHIGVRFPGELADRLDRWRREMPAEPTRSQAVRYLVSLALSEYEARMGRVRAHGAGTH